MTMNNQEGLLIVISGSSGVGKGTVCSKLLESQPNMKLSVSHTTRPPLEGEKEGINYFFTSKDAFEANIENDAYLEWARVYDDYYGTPRDFVEQNLNVGIDTLLEIDTQGAILVKEKFPEGIFIFLLPPSYAALKARLEGRNTETPEKIAKRLSQFQAELARVPMYDYVVVNEEGKVDETVAKIQAIIMAEHLKFEHSKDYTVFSMEGDTL